MSGINLGDMAQLARSIAEKYDVGKEYTADFISKVASNAHNRYPEDPVIGQFAFVFEKVASKSPASIVNQKQIYDVYNNFVSLSANSHFKDELGFLLKSEPVQENKQNPYSAQHGDGKIISTSADESLVKTASVLFKKSSFETCSDVSINNGKNVIDAELKSLGFKHAKVDFLGGNAVGMVYAAHFETNRGLVSVAIPVEIKNGNVLMPKAFFVNDQLEDLNSSNLNNYIEKSASTSPISVEPLNYSSPVVEVPKEIAHLTRDFENDVVESASSFGLKSIRVGREVVANELLSFGFRGVQIKYAGESEDSVTYIAAIDTACGKVDIEVPVEMKSAASSYIPLPPTHFSYDGLVQEFCAEKLQKFAANVPAPSTCSKVYSSVFNYMTLKELKDEILKAAGCGDYISCEGALQEIQEKFSEEDFKNAFADYHHVLMVKNSMEELAVHKCPRMIPAGKVSIYPYCGCLNVPMHKVVAGENGKCVLKSSVEKQKLNPIKESCTAISTSKIIFS